MTATSDALEGQERPSLLRRIWNWLLAFEEAMDYDPHEHHYKSLRAVRQEIEDLKLRLAEIEDPQKAGD